MDVMLCMSLAQSDREEVRLIVKRGLKEFRVSHFILR